MIVTDDELRASLQGFINRAVSPSAGEVTVSVDRGVVTLSGRVETATQRHAIRDLIAASDGVRHVLYAIEVGSAARQLA